jgi:hypothetical protein
MPTLHDKLDTIIDLLAPPVRIEDPLRQQAYRQGMGGLSSLGSLGSLGSNPFAAFRAGSMVDQLMNAQMANMAHDAYNSPIHTQHTFSEDFGDKIVEMCVRHKAIP